MIKLSLCLSWKLRSFDICIKPFNSWSLIPQFYIDEEEDFFWRLDFLFLHLVYVNRIDWAYLLFKDKEDGNNEVQEV